MHSAGYQGIIGEYNPNLTLKHVEENTKILKKEYLRIGSQRWHKLGLKKIRESIRQILGEDIAVRGISMCMVYGYTT